MDFFKKFKVEKPAFQPLAEGEHVVHVTAFAETDSFLNFNGTQKDELPEWCNPTPQIAITVAGKNGSMVHRLNGCGWVKFEDLTEEQLNSGNYEDIGGYACYEEKGNTLRLLCPEKTQACSNIINQVATSLGIAEGRSLFDGFKTAVDEKYEMRVTVVKDIYNDKDQYRLSKFRSLTAEVKETEFVD
jgi:hypothetical protein